jgi:plastocyanin
MRLLPLAPAVLALLGGLAAAAPAASAAAAAAATHTVVIDGMQFQPARLAVRRGESVTWVNRDLVEHTVTAAPTLDSGKIAPGQSWTIRASKAGTYDYHCDLHPTMQAQLTVR